MNMNDLYKHSPSYHENDMMVNTCHYIWDLEGEEHYELRRLSHIVVKESCISWQLNVFETEQISGL